MIIILLAIGYGTVALALWWLVPLAFPTLTAFNYLNALALTGLLTLCIAPAAWR